MWGGGFVVRTELAKMQELVHVEQLAQQPQLNEKKYFNLTYSFH